MGRLEGGGNGVQSDLVAVLTLCCFYGVCLAVGPSTDLPKPLFWAHRNGNKPDVNKERALL